MLMPMVAFAVWLFFLTGLTFLFWLRPQSFFHRVDGDDRVSEAHMLMATVLAVLLFLSCFILGVSLALADIRGLSWRL